MNFAHFIWITVALHSFTTFPVAGGYMQPSNRYEEFAQQVNCTNFTNEISEHLKSPGYPNNYSLNLDCRKVIKAGPQFTVNLKFMIFHLEDSEECQYDYIEIRDGMYGFSPLIFRGCADDIRQGKIFKSTGQYMWIRFVSDYQITRKGFLAKISAAPQTGSSNKIEAFPCYSVIEGVTSFDISTSSIPSESLDVYAQNPNQPIDCMWDIRMPPNSKVFSRLYNYSVEHLTPHCDSNYIEIYDMSTSSSDRQLKGCRSLYSPYISKDFRMIVHLHAHSFHTLPEFQITGNIYLPSSAGNCTHESMFNCFDGYCIPAKLRCNSYENCREGYDEDCFIEEVSKSFDTKYIALFTVVIVGSIVLTTTLTLVEVTQKQKSIRKEAARRKSLSTSSATTLKSASQTSHNSLPYSKQHSVNIPRTERSVSVTAGSATVGSPTSTFTSSRLNENVSFSKKPSTPVMSRLAKYDGSDRVYAMPHITLPPNDSLSKLPPAPPTPPPPPPIPVDEGRGFRLIHDLTSMGNTANFEYPPPPSSLKLEDSTDYSSTSSSSFGSLPKDQDHKVACFGQRRAKPTHLKVEATVDTHPPFQPAKRIASKPQAPVATKHWTFDDDTDDGAMELTTYISTC